MVKLMSKDSTHKFSDPLFLQETLISWAQINTHWKNHKGIEKLQKLIRQEFEALRAEVSLVASTPKQRHQIDGSVQSIEAAPLFVAQKRTQAPYQVLLMGHLDTVFPQESPFQSCSLEETGLLRGPGVADMKGGVLVMLAALARLEELAPEALGWTVLLNSDEEIGSPCSTELLEPFVRQAQIGLLFEPSLPDGSLVAERGSSSSYLISSKGKAAHSGRAFNEGINAIIPLCELATSLHQFNELFPKANLNVAMIQGGQAPNIIADAANLIINARCQDRKTLGALETALEEKIHNTQKHYPGQLELHLLSKRPPKPLNSQTEKIQARLIECGSKLGMDLHFGNSSGVCDGNNLAALGLPNIDTLGVCGGQLHSDQEFMEISSLRERSDLCYEFLKSLINEGLPYERNTV